MTNKFDMPPHTEAKHSILRLYLERWFPILNSKWSVLAYIDGFAGPGVYRDGEPGSPIIALKAAGKYADRADFSPRFWFIEPDPARHASLTRQVSKAGSGGKIRVEGILKSTFEEAFPAIIEGLQDEGMPPTFVLVDPSGYSGVKMETLARFLENPSCEFMFTFMEGFLRRFVGLPEESRKRQLDELFGTDEWTKSLDMRGPGQIRFFLDLYTSQLRRRGVKHTQTFEMCDENEKTIYHLVFATNNKRGLEVMKEAMVRVDPKFTFRVSDAMVPGQTHLFSFGGSRDWYKQAAGLIFREYAGRRCVPLAEIECFVITDTPYVYRKGIINLMKKSEQVASIDAYEPTIKMKDALKFLVTFKDVDSD